MKHLFILTDVDGKIRSASSEDLIGRNIDSVVRMDSVSSATGYRAFGRSDRRDWMVAALPGSSRFSSDRYFLLRERSGDAGYIRQFVGIHTLHILATLLAFGLLVSFLSKRYVTRPILELAGAIRRIEAGDLMVDVPMGQGDEFGWLARRFAAMGGRLEDAIRRLVRSEKYASVAIVTFRIAHKLRDPLASLQRHITYIDGLSGESRDLERIASSLRQDRAEILEAIRQLNEIEPPEE